MHPIKQLRQSRRVGQKELAAVMEVSQATVSEWENGRKSPSTENIRKLAAYFGVSADFLLRAEGSAPAVPVMGRVAAGIPISAAEDILDYEELSADMARRGEYFALQIRGDSMEPKISDGDVVIVRHQDRVENGEIAIVLVGGEEATCKRVMVYDEGITLVSNNPVYPPMFFTKQEVAQLPVTILGKVVELRAKF